LTPESCWRCSSSTSLFREPTEALRENKCRLSLRERRLFREVVHLPILSALLVALYCSSGKAQLDGFDRLPIEWMHVSTFSGIIDSGKNVLFFHCFSPRGD